MYGKLVIACLSIGLCTGAAAQVSLQATVPTVGLVQKNQLWNLVLVNSGTRQFDCRLQLAVRDRSTGQEVMTATTASFALPVGARQLNANLLAPVQYNYLAAFTGNQWQALLPVGTYVACYTLVGENIKENSLAEECIQFDAEPLSPPQLSFPADSAVLETAPHQFAWLPPMPAGMFTRLQYDIVVAEVKSGQLAHEAIQENLPEYTQGSLIANSLNYSPNLPKLEPGKWYAWQVVARDNNTYAAKTDTWVFMVKESSVAQSIEEQTPYIKMRKANPEKGIAPNGVLKLSYVNETTDSVVTVQIVSIGEVARRQPVQFTVAVRPGENLIRQDLAKLFAAEEGRVYEAQIRNSRSEKWTMQFEVRQYHTKQ
jgi:hypothetical protein